MQFKNILKVTLINICVLLTTAPAIARAEEAVFYLDPMIVTADYYTENKEEQPGYYKIDGTKLENAHYQDALEVMQSLPGVSISTMGSSGGLNPYSTVLLNGSDRYIVIVDGVRVNWNGNLNNNFDFSTLPAEILQSIEVLPPSEGITYGSAAKGGVIKITTKKAESISKTSIGLETGSFGLERENFLHFGKKQDWSWRVFAQKNIARDYKTAWNEVPSYENTENINLSLNKSWGEASDLTLDYSDFRGRYSSKIFRSANIITQGEDNNLAKDNGADPNAYVADNILVNGHKHENSISLRYDRKLTDKENNVLVVYRRTSDSVYDDNPELLLRPWIMNLRTEGFSNRYDKRWHDKHLLVAGAEYYREKIVDYQDLKSRYFDTSMVNKAVYVQNVWQVDDAVKITGTVRGDHNSCVGGKLSPALAVEYKPTGKLAYNASYTSYFAPPKQAQLFSSYGDINLLPEEGKIYEMGVSYTPDDTLILKTNLFYRDATNVIAVDTSLPPSQRRYANIAQETSKGFNVSINKRFSDNFEAALVYTKTLVDIERKNSLPISTMIPNGEMFLNLMYHKDKYNALLQGRGVFDQSNGRGDNLYFNNNYFVWNLATSYKLQKNTQIYLKVNNIFDQFYSSNDNYAGAPFDQWYADPGRNYQIGVNYTF